MIIGRTRVSTYNSPTKLEFVETAASLNAGQVVEPSREMHSCAMTPCENRVKAPNSIYLAMSILGAVLAWWIAVTKFRYPRWL